MALRLEVSELVEIFKWMNDEELMALKLVKNKIDSVNAELADIATYLLRISDIMCVDLEKAISEKLQETATKYPPGANTPSSQH